MSKWEALKIELQYISWNWEDSKHSPLHPTWLYILMEIAEEAHANNWDKEKIEKEMEDRR